MILVLKWVFWIFLGLGLYVYFIYPAILALLAGIFGRQSKSDSELQDHDLPVTALLIACFNEEKEIEKKIENSVSLEYPGEKFKILVLNDGSVDRTVELARKAIGLHPDAVIEILDFQENRGKCTTLMNGVKWVRENWPDVEILAFTDANAQWEPGALRKLTAPFVDPKVGSVSGLLRYINPKGVSAGDMEGLYWKYEAAIKRLSSRLGSLPGANGSIFAVRLDAYDPISPERGDDFELPVQAILKGYKSVLIEDAVSRELPSSDFQSEYRRKLRITGQMIPSALLLLGRAIIRGRGLIAFQLLSHKVLRYMVPVYQILLLLSSGLLLNESMFYRIAFLLQLVFYILAGLGLLVERSGAKPHKVLQLPLYFTMVNLASLVSMVRVAMGKRVVWEKNR